MAKRGKASKLMSLVADEAPETSIGSTTVVESKGPQLSVDVCGCCGKTGPIVYHDADEKWESPGHPDHLYRAVCVECVLKEANRRNLCRAVFEAMRKRLSADGMVSYQIDEAVHTAWRTFQVERDTDALLKLAKQLKIGSDLVRGI